MLPRLSQRRKGFTALTAISIGIEKFWGGCHLCRWYSRVLPSVGRQEGWIDCSISLVDQS